jgi:drug/metabolite transporter (DMT)-like permease
VYVERSGELPVTVAAGARSRTGQVGGLVQVVVATCLWSSSALLIEQLSGAYGMAPVRIALWRVLLALPLVGAALAVRRTRALALPWREVPLYATFGLVGVTLSYVAWATSVKVNSAPVAAALAFSAPVFVVAGDRLFFGARLYLTQLGAIAVNLLGCALVAGVRSPADLWQRPEGLAIGLAVGLTFASYTLLGRAAARSRHIDPLATMLYLFVFGGLGLLAAALLTGGADALQPQLSVHGWLLLVALAAGPTLIAYALYNVSLHSLPATLATVCTSLEPVLVAIGAAVFLGHALSARQAAGIALVVGAVLVMQWQAFRQNDA